MDPINEEVYRFISSYIQEHGYSPSLRDIAKGCYLGRSTVIRHLDKLEAADLITRDPNVARSITLIKHLPEG
ncbi:MAG TPA: winged helix-turn-helix transcriptional regulator [Phototrophicaceae bacterium]|jgi:repressor LexA|nr:winged helix-turn-helix transcriptional regulator [Phototrophicaceae bacterium]